MKATIVTLSSLAIATTLSFAQNTPAGPPKGHPGGPEGKRPPPEEVFKKHDTNGDGVLSLEEFKASHRAKKDETKAEERYKKMDANGDGKVTLEEFKAFHREHKPGGPGGKGHGPAKGGEAPPAAPAGQ
ncbi:MAG: EF-hand domain-containing protein [Verrucomicrobia bacterium]|nr:MAG: EF-hand domain-containing protein [Verrucomicrobiota bacterium]